MEIFRADFDRLAQFGDEPWSHNGHYHDFLLRQLPPHCETALDIGCGLGAFSRKLAERSTQVLGVDLSPEMIAGAKRLSKDYPNTVFQVDDVTTWTFPENHFDCVASIATFHHLPLERMLPKIAASLRPNGTLIVLDLYERGGWSDMLRDVISVPYSIAMKGIHNGRFRTDPAVAAAWAEHSKHDHYMRIPVIQRIAERAMPGVVVRCHVLWRYSMVWRKPTEHPSL